MVVAETEWPDDNDDGHVDERTFDPTFLEERGASDEANDDFDPLQLPEDTPDDGYWVSDQQEKELQMPQAGVYPKATDWQRVADDDIRDMRVTVDKARRFLWKGAKTEMFILRRYWDEDHPSFDSLCENLFGKQSELFHLFQTELNIDYESFCRFLATFYTASMLNVTAPRLYELDRFDTTGLMKTKGDFLKILRRMETVDEGNQGDTLWMKLEYVFNSQMRRIFLSKRGNEELTIALDDDKVHFNYGKNSKTYGLKRHRHIKDNRFGHTLHTAGFSGSGAILQAVFEREGESSTDCYDKSLKELFGSRTGNGAPDLRGTTWCSDRGYWTFKLLFDLILAQGGDVVGTVARCAWYPFTFSKMKPSNDNSADKYERTEVSMKGYKDVFYKTLEWLHTKIRATCYRSGTGTAVSLAMSSVHHGPLFDLNLSFPRDHRDYFDLTQTQEARDAKAFPCVCGTPNYYDSVKDLPIIPLTRVQGDTSWFIMRKFGLTSSTVDKMISARAGEITCDHDQRDNYEVILAAVDRLNLLPRQAAPAATTRDIDTNESDDEQQDNDEEEEEPVDEVSREALKWISCVDDGDDDVFQLQLGNLSERVVRKIVALHDHSNSVAQIARLRNELEKWSSEGNRLRRKYYWFKRLNLIQRIKEINPSIKITGKKKAELLDILVAIEDIQANCAAALAAGDDPFLSSIDPVLLQVFRASFMRPLKDEAKKYCRQGHALERPFLQQFFEHSQQGKTRNYKALAIFETPLVQSSVADQPPGVLDSSDAELVYSFDDSEPLAMPIEIKSRVAHTTFYAERLRLEANLGLAAFENDGEACYVEIDADGNDLSKWIPKHKECFQLMHHVAVRNLRKGLILVGNSSKVMFGVFVNYSDRLIEAYQAVLRDLFDRTLLPFYKPVDELQLPFDKIDHILKSKEMKPMGLSIHSFTTSYFIWRRLCLEGDVSLPIPPCNRILPYNHSFWNNMKGASDTATKLFWNCQVKFASYGRSQTICIGRFIQLYAVCIHRQNHVATAKTDLNRYGSLVHFRNSRNRHWPFHKTVNGIALWLIKAGDELDRENTNHMNDVPDIVPRTPPRVARDNPTRPFVEDRAYATACGATPGRGKLKFPRNKTLQWQEDQRRLHNCVGNLFHVGGKKRNPCYLCNTNTSFMCLGCKRFYCCVNRYEKIHRLILKDDAVVGFLNGVCPPAALNIKAISNDGTASDFSTVENSCYHICHKKAVSLGAAATMARKPLASIEESRNSNDISYSPSASPLSFY